MFHNNGLPESLAVVLVKEQGVACDPGLPPVQPSSPYHLARHGVLRHQPPNLGPDWAAISGTDHRMEEQGCRGGGPKACNTGHSLEDDKLVLETWPSSARQGILKFPPGPPVSTPCSYGSWGPCLSEQGP